MQQLVPAAVVTVIIAAACGRSGLLVAESRRDEPIEPPDSENAPPPPAIGSGGPAPAPPPQAGRSASQPVPPPPPTMDPPSDLAEPFTPITREDVESLNPGGILPDCTALGLSEPAPRPSRFIALRGSGVFGEAPSVYVVEVGENGPGQLHEVGPSFITFGVGSWSDDGRFFGFTAPDENPAFSGGVYVVEVQPGAEPLPRHVAGEGSFRGFAPGRTRFATVMPGGRAQIFEAADWQTPAKDVELPPGSRVLQWSTDGRYLAVEGDDASQLHLIDTDVDEPIALPYGPEGEWASNARWSPTGRRVAYTLWNGSENELLVFDLDDQQLPAIRVSEEVDNVNSALGNHAWLDADRLLVDDKSGELRIVSLTSSPPESRTIAVNLEQGFMLLPGHRCLVYRGRCGPDDTLGACLLSLDPGAGEPARAIFPGEHYWLRTSIQGSPVAFVDVGSKLIVELVLDGSPYAPRIVTEGEQNVRIDEAAYLSPEPDPAWLYYPASSQARFWNRNTERTFTIDPEGLSYGDGGRFSPDGRLFAVFARDRGFPPSRAPLMIQRLDDMELRERWPIEVFIDLSAFLHNEVAWQP